MAVLSTICLVSSLLLRVDGSEFLGAQQHHMSESPISKVEVEEVFLSELNSVDVNRSQEFERELRPLFVTMPKNDHGNLEPSSVRYMLHRYFAQKYGWHMIGLDHAAGAWNTSAPTSLLKNQVPAYIEDIFEKKMNAKGLGLPELSVLAATLTDLISKETYEEVEYIYTALKLKQNVPLSKMELKRFFTSFLIVKVWGIEEGQNSAQVLKAGLRGLEEEYLGWPATKMWNSDEVETFDHLYRTVRNPFLAGFPVDKVLSMAAEFSHRHSLFHDVQCRSLKNQLLEMEYKGTGRVLLSTFYSGYKSDDWAFVESQGYLRDIGVLDETSIPGRPSVIIQNYLLGPSNCFETSGYYKLCCRDECEDIRAQVEAKVGTPSASALSIAKLVSEIGSESVHAPRNLSSALVERLHLIAEHHDGSVPLHGRLFAQWLHHAYPQECPFPHVSGSISHQSPMDWAEAKGFKDANADDREMFKLSRNAASASSEHVEESLPWTSVEELVSVHNRRNKIGGSWWARLRFGIAIAVIVSVAYPISTAVKVRPPLKAESHLV